MKAPAQLLAALALVSCIPHSVLAQVCGSYADFNEYATRVTAACCDSTHPCVGGLPSACNGECAADLLPMVTNCAALMTVMGVSDQINDALATWSVRAFPRPLEIPRALHCHRCLRGCTMVSPGLHDAGYVNVNVDVVLTLSTTPGHPCATPGCPPSTTLMLNRHRRAVMAPRHRRRPPPASRPGGRAPRSPRPTSPPPPSRPPTSSTPPTPPTSCSTPTSMTGPACRSWRRHRFAPATRTSTHRGPSFKSTTAGTTTVPPRTTLWPSRWAGARTHCTSGPRSWTTPTRTPAVAGTATLSRCACLSSPSPPMLLLLHTTKIHAFCFGLLPLPATLLLLSPRPHPPPPPPPSPVYKGPHELSAETHNRIT